METARTTLQALDAFSSPPVFALLLAAAALLVWMAFAPGRPAPAVQQRLEGYLDRHDAVDAVEEEELRRPLVSRTVAPLLRRILRFLGRLLPSRNAQQTSMMLVQAGEPFGLTALDFFGVRLLTILLLAGGYFWLFGRDQALSTALRNTLLLAVAGYLLPTFWLRSKVGGRKHTIARALPDALDMLTIGVEAGLAFESALIRVGEKWDNALTREFRRAVGEMRVGSSREEALGRMAARCGVPELNTFIAVLIQSTQLGVSISQVLHAQAAEMRTKRQQRAEELARQAGIKMVFPLVFLIFPVLFMVILGPTVPRIIVLLANMQGSGSSLP